MTAVVLGSHLGSSASGFCQESATLCDRRLRRVRRRRNQAGNLSKTDIDIGSSFFQPWRTDLQTT
jgi:hypothetical protein